MKLKLLLILVFLVVAGCGPSGPSATEGDIAAVVFGSSDNLDAMKDATKVTACRINPASPEAPYDQTVRADVTLAAYKEGTWIDVSSSQTDRLRQVLLTPSTYRFDSVSGCLPVFAVRVRFEGEGGNIDINLCLKCSQIVVIRDGQFVGAEEFHGGARELIALCKEWFPDDVEIQGLKG